MPFRATRPEPAGSTPKELSKRVFPRHIAGCLYLQRLRDTDVLLAAVQDGIASLTWERETFAYADSNDASSHRYLGLKVGQQIMPSLDGVLVKPEVAAAQIAADMISKVQPTGSSFTYGQSGESNAGQFVADGGAE